MQILSILSVYRIKQRRKCFIFYDSASVYGKTGSATTCSILSKFYKGLPLLAALGRLFGQALIKFLFFSFLFLMEGLQGEAEPQVVVAAAWRAVAAVGRATVRRAEAPATATKHPVRADLQSARCEYQDF